MNRIHCMVVVFGLALASGCKTIGDAVDELRWATPHDVTTSTKETADAVATARRALHDDHVALANGDAEALNLSGETATKAEKERVAKLEQKLRDQEDGLRLVRDRVHEVLGSIPGPIGVVFEGLLDPHKKSLDRLEQITGTQETRIESARDLAQGAKGEAGQAIAAAERARVVGEDANKESVGNAQAIIRLDESSKQALERIRNLEGVAKKLEGISSDDLDSLRKAVNDPARFDAELEKLLAAKGLTTREIDEVKAATSGMSSTQILELLAAIAAGGGLGTFGGRKLSNSGKRLDEHKAQLDELYDRLTKLQVQAGRRCDGEPTNKLS